MRLPEISALIDLAACQHGSDPSIQLSTSFLFRCTGITQGTQRGLVPDTVNLQEAVEVLQLFNLPEDVSLHDIALVLSPSTVTTSQQSQQVWLDSLLGLLCLLSSGDAADKLKCCYWALDRDGSNSLTLHELLAVLPALSATAAAARLILKQVTSESLRLELADPTAQALVHQRLQVLQNVLQQAFQEADPLRTGVLRPGEQFKQLLFSVAATLTAVLIGAAPIPQPMSDISPPPPVATGTVDADYFLSDSGSAGYVDALGSMSGGSAGSSAELAPPVGNRASDNMSLEGNLGRSSSPDHQSDKSSHQGMEGGAQTAADQLPVDILAAPPNMQPQLQTQGSGAAPAHHQAADVLVVDHAGGVLHYSCTIQEAAAAAASGRPPHSRPGAEVHVYPQTLASVRSQQGTPRASLTTQVSALTEPQQMLLHQQQHSHSGSAATSTPQFLSPLNSMIRRSTTEDSRQSQLDVASTYDSMPGSQQPAVTTADKPHFTAAVAAAAAGKRLIDRLKEGAHHDASGEQLITQEAPLLAVQGASTVGALAGSGAITTTAGTVMQSVQDNIAAASVRVLSYCGLCFLLTTLVVLGDAALVAGLHLGARLQLAVAFGITVGANLVLMLLLVAVLVAVHIRNNRDSVSLQEKLNSPQAQQLDQVLVNLTEALAALKKQEAQKSQNTAHTGPATATTSRRMTTAYTPEGGASSRDMQPDDVQLRAQSGFLSRLQPLWAAVGRIAGFEQQGPLPEVGSLQLQGSYEGHSTLNVASEDGAGVGSGDVAVNVGPGAGRSSSTGGGSWPGQRPYHGVQRQSGAYQQSRVVRVKGTAAPGHTAVAGGKAGSVSVKEAYPL